MDETLISIIVPVYNVENYLDRCIESIVGQTYRNIEILLLDDESTDKSGEICDKWAMKDVRIKVFHLPHGGLSIARNVGLREMTGRYILFVDSDDYIAKDLIETAYNNLLKHEADLVIFDFINFYSDKDKIEALRDKKISLIERQQVLYMMYGKRADVVFLVWNKLYKKEVFAGIMFPEGRVYEDNAIAHKVLERCNIIVYDENPYYFRQLRKDSIMGKSKQFSKRNLQILYGQRERCELYGELEDKRLVSLAYAEYMHTLIVSYYNTRFILKDKNICNDLYREFCRVYKLTKGKIKFDRKKTVGYYLFGHFPKMVTTGMKIKSSR